MEIVAVARTPARSEKLIPELPDIGGKKHQFSKVIEINGWIISLCRAMKAEGRTTEEVDGGWSLRFSECAVNKFYEAQGAEELKPYCNFFDVTYSRHLGMGIDATRTIGLGCETCTLAYRRGRDSATAPGALASYLTVPCTPRS